MVNYDKNYYENLKKQHIKTAKLINEIRWNFVQDVPFKTVLDYGCGCGELSLYAPKNRDLIIHSYDIGKINGSTYPQTGILIDHYDLTFFNDVIEHVDWINYPDLDMVHAFEISTFICIAIPVWNHSIENIHTWKHYKPGEHLYYFSESSIIEFFYLRKFVLIKKGYPECPPREDIFSAIFKKKEL